MRGGRYFSLDDTMEHVRAARAVGWRAERIDPAGDTARQIAEALTQHGVAV